MFRSWLVAFKLARKLSFFSSASFSASIQRIASLTLAFSVATMIATVALVGGFKKAVTDKLYHIWGSHRIVSTAMANESIGEYKGLNRNEALETLLEKHDFAFDRFSSLFVIMQTDIGVEGVMLKSYEDPNRWNDFLIEKENLEIGDSSGLQVIVSKKIAQKYRLKLGDKLWIHFFDAEQGATFGTRIRPMRIAGIYHTGVVDYDQKVIHCHASVLRKMGYDGIGGYEIFANGIHAKRQAELNRIFLSLPWEWSGIAIEKIMPDLFDWIYYVQSTETIFILVLGLLIMVNLMIGFMLFVVDRSRMVGILLAIGYEKKMIFMIILFSGLASNILGLFMGVIIATLFLYGQSVFGWIKLNEEVHYLSSAQIDIDLWVWLGVLALMSFICILSLLLPAQFATKFKVIKVLRFS